MNFGEPFVDGNSKTRQMAQREKCQKVREASSVTQRNLETVDSHARVWKTGDKPHAAAAQFRTATSSTRVDQTGSQPHMISESRCRAKLHGIFKTMLNVKAEMVVFSCCWADLISLSVAKLHGYLPQETWS